MNVVITGANRGIGLGLVQHYLAQGASVWACYRRDVSGLAGISSGQLHIVNLDITQDFDVTLFPESIDLLINNAGIYGPKKDGQTLDKVTVETMLEVFHVDCAGPLHVVQKLKDKVIKAKIGSLLMHGFQIKERGQSL